MWPREKKSKIKKNIANQRLDRSPRHHHSNDQILKHRQRADEEELDTESEIDSALLLPPSLDTAPTPQVTPTVTPASSMEHIPMAAAKPPMPKPGKKTKKIKASSPGVVAIAPNVMNFAKLTKEEVLDEIKSGRYLKYIFENYGFSQDTVRKMTFSKQIVIEAKDIYHVSVERFEGIRTGTHMKLGGKKE